MVDPVFEDQERTSRLKYEVELDGNKQLNIKSRSQLLLQNSAGAPEETASFENNKDQPIANTGRVKGSAEALDYDQDSQGQSAQTKRGGIHSTEMNTGNHTLDMAEHKEYIPKEFDNEKYAIKTLINDIPYAEETDGFTQEMITEQRRALVKDALSLGL